MLVFVGLLTAASERRFGWWNGKDDLKLAILASDSVGVVSISPARRMVNVFKTKPEVELWIPGGLSWYRTDRIRRIIESEKKQEELENFFFYNFGFKGRTIVVLDKFEDWKKNRNLIFKIGLHNWLRYQYLTKEMLIKEDEFAARIDKDQLIGEVFSRDFSDDRLLDEQVRVTVINASDMPGMASWLASRLEWMGMSVVGLETVNDKQVDCQLIMPSDGTRKLWSYQIIKEILNCEERINPEIGDREMEIYLGRQIGEMLKYASYDRP